MENLVRLETILRELKKFPERKPEKTIFSIGARRHFENPTSDILAFFLNPHEEHGFGDLVLRSLLEAIEAKNISTIGYAKAEREVRTDNGNRIDILLESPKQIILIENKIGHYSDNPYADYEQHVEKRFERNERPILILLSIKDEERPNENWSIVTYRKFITNVYRNLGEYLFGHSTKYSKWHVLLREFLLNIEQEYEENNMSENEFRFISDNYADISRLKNLRSEYSEHIRKHVCEFLDWGDKQSEVKEWGSGITVIKLYPESNKSTDITIMLETDGSFTVKLYLDKRGYEIMKNEKLGSWFPEEGCECVILPNRKDLGLIQSDIKDVVTKLSRDGASSP